MDLGSLRFLTFGLIAAAMAALTRVLPRPSAARSAAFDDHQPFEAARYWRQLLAQLPERAPQRRELEIAIERAEMLATSVRAEAR